MVLRDAGINARIPLDSPCYKLATVTAAEADLKIRLRERLSDLCFFGFSRDK